jgi:hypothetical protein
LSARSARGEAEDTTMPGRGRRLLFRIAGWLLTPLVLLTAASIGALLGLVIAARVHSPNTGLILTVVLAFVAAIAGLVLWVRMLRDHPRLRHTLEMAIDGSPDSPIVQAIIHPDVPRSDTES